MAAAGVSGLVVVSGPSGAGKSTVCKALAARYGYEISVSVTTRPPREGEENGREYSFVMPEAFRETVAQGGFMEHSEHFGHCYGTPRGPIDEAVRNGRVIILEIDVNGALQVKQQMPNALYICLVAPSSGETERRLRQRSSDDAEAIRLRLQRAAMEKAMLAHYKHHVVNDDLDATVEEIHKLIKVEASSHNGC